MNNQIDSIVVFSHLRWNFVMQRPQHIISRLAKTKKVIFVEEPIGFTSETRGTAELERISKNLIVLRPKISTTFLDQELPPILKMYLSEYHFQRPVLWFYSPMFVKMAEKIDHSLVVYDCMDQLSSFMGAPPELVMKERELFEVCDVVFTGGHSLYAEKSKYHNNVHCFQSAVDKKHFKSIYTPFTRIPKDIRNIPKPRILFYGVIDERIDLSLIRYLSKRLPTYSFVLLGPTAKIDIHYLPQADNLHFLGMKSYSSLPSYLKAANVTFMPFALNKATRFISPTKTLEFMAAGKPIVSTPITDVERPYKDVVSIAYTPEQFAQSLEDYVHETKNQAEIRTRLQQNILKSSSWNSTVFEMESIMASNFQTEQKPELNDLSLPKNPGFLFGLNYAKT